MEKFTYYTPKVESSGRKSPRTPPGTPPAETPSGSPPGDKTPSRLSECGSPEPNCAICLGKLQNKSFTDSCLHTFCFNCLLEWSKVKPECPLCKQSFKSIIHNVRSMEEYEEYHLRPTVADAVCQFSRTFRYRTTITFGHGYRANDDRHMEDDFIPPLRLPAIHRRRHPHDSLAFRRHVYDDNLWANPLPDVTGRFRESNPEFYRNNPGQVPRLVGWLSRELTALLNNSPHTLVIADRILAALNIHEIRSVGFRTEIQGYIVREHTDHFVHEFFVYATTPYDMMGYDEMVVYFPRTNYFVTEIHDSSSSTDSDIVVLDDEGESTTNTRVRRIRDIYDSSPEPGPSRRREEWPGPSRPREERPESSGAREDRHRRSREEQPGPSRSLEEKPGPSRRREEKPGPSRKREERVRPSRWEEERPGTSRQEERQRSENESYSRAQDNPTSVSDDDIVVVGVVKPRHERTPEIIDLSSDEEPEVIVERQITENQEEESVSWLDVEPSYNFKKWKFLRSITSSDSSEPSSVSSFSESENSDTDYHPSPENSRSRPRRRRTVKTRTTRFKVTRSKATSRKSSKTCTEEKKCTSKKKHTKSRSRGSTRSLSPLSLSSVSSSSSRWSNTATNGSEVKSWWRIKKSDRDGESSSDDLHDSNTIHIRPPYTTRELETDFGQDRRPKLRSIIIARSNPGPSTSNNTDNEPSRSSRRNHSHSTSKHKKQKHCERKKKKKSRHSHKKRHKNSSSSSSTSSSSDWNPRSRQRKKSKKYVSTDSSS